LGGGTRQAAVEREELRAELAAAAAELAIVKLRPELQAGLAVELENVKKMREELAHELQMVAVQVGLTEDAEMQQILEEEDATAAQQLADGDGLAVDLRRVIQFVYSEMLERKLSLFQVRSFFAQHSTVFAECLTRSDHDGVVMRRRSMETTTTPRWRRLK
jgi:hypothetical protein